MASERFLRCPILHDPAEDERRNVVEFAKLGVSRVHRHVADRKYLGTIVMLGETSISKLSARFYLTNIEQFRSAQEAPEMFRTLGLWFTASLVVGCSGHIVLTPLDPMTKGNPSVVKDINTPEGKSALDSGYGGLVVYLPIQVLQVDKFTQRQTVSGDGKTVILSADCDNSDPHAYIQKVVTIVDREHPFLLQYKHGFLESYNFAATLTSDGALASINTSSNPDQGKTLANLSSAAVSAAKIAAAPAKGREPCTQTPSFVQYAPLPAVRSLP